MLNQFISFIALQQSSIWSGGVIGAIIMLAVFAALIIAMILFMRQKK